MAESLTLPDRPPPDNAQESGQEPASLQRESRLIRDLELTTLFEPQAETVVAEIVFVHGLQGRPWRTWRYKEPRKTIFSKAPRARAFWLSEPKQYLTTWPNVPQRCDGQAS